MNHMVSFCALSFRNNEAGPFYPISTPVELIVYCVDENDLRVFIDWGDGTSLQEIEVECDRSFGGPGESTVIVPHTYASGAIYPITASASDEWGIGTDSFADVFAYDENNGLKIEAKADFPSSNGAVFGISYTGTAEFELEAQYKNCRGSPLIAGSFEFTLKDYPNPDGFNFLAVSLDFLLIDNSVDEEYNAVLKGLGELNGSEGYWFLVFMKDFDSTAKGKEAHEETDTVRIMIFSNSPRTPPVYDNLFGTDLAVDYFNGTEIAKGAIKVKEQKGSADSCDLKKSEVGPTQVGEGLDTEVVVATLNGGGEGLFRRRSLERETPLFD